MLVVTLQRPVGDLVHAGAIRCLVARQHHVRLEQAAGDVDALVEELGIERVEHA